MRGIPLLIVAVGVAGCSSDEPKREFAVPKVLCEVPVPGDALSALLPESGKLLTSPEYTFSIDGEGLCKVSVDDDVVLMVSRERIDIGDSAYNILRSRARVPSQKSAEDGSISYADRAAASLTKCRGAGVEKEDISILITVLKPARPDEDAMKDLITSYTTGYQKQHPCRPGS
ncbi:hypothetical protein ACF061_36660 [Streptomyces sp. NPDC015220]|uniref:hypothetical protein n=1 Tax=Streptomyces sp. NPDC015220 TaxID=3364947 RepID=UPI0036F8CD7B